MNRPIDTSGLVLPAAPTALADQPPVNTLKNSDFSSRTDTAINGYDTMAYFTAGKPVKGLDSLSTPWMGAAWKFSSQGHRVPAAAQAVIPLLSNAIHSGVMP